MTTLLDLPDEVLLSIYKELGPKDRFSFSMALPKEYKFWCSKDINMSIVTLPMVLKTLKQIPKEGFPHTKLYDYLINASNDPLAASILKEFGFSNVTPKVDSISIFKKSLLSAIADKNEKNIKTLLNESSRINILFQEHFIDIILCIAKHATPDIWNIFYVNDVFHEECCSSSVTILNTIILQRNTELLSYFMKQHEFDPWYKNCVKNFKRSIVWQNTLDVESVKIVLKYIPHSIKEMKHLLVTNVVEARFSIARIFVEHIREKIKDKMASYYG
jgi:signal transduction protein with GAF and PtsI domain